MKIEDMPTLDEARREFKRAPNFYTAVVYYWLAMTAFHDGTMERQEVDAIHTKVCGYLIGRKPEGTEASDMAIETEVWGRNRSVEFRMPGGKPLVVTQIDQTLNNGDTIEITGAALRLDLE